MEVNDNQLGRDKQEITNEADSYYQPENKSNSGAAILYGLFALVVTLIVAAGLYFGGRAVYRALTGSSSDQSATEQQENQNTPTSSNENQQNQPADNENSSNQTPGVDPGSSDASDGFESGSEDIPSTGDSETESISSTGDSLPSTGSPSGM